MICRRMKEEIVIQKIWNDSEQIHNTQMQDSSYNFYSQNESVYKKTFFKGITSKIPSDSI